MARLLDGYERSRGDGPRAAARPLPARRDLRAVPRLSATCGARTTRRHRNGAEYTRTHVSRGAAFLQEYLPTHRPGANSRDAAAADRAFHRLRAAGRDHPRRRPDAAPHREMLGTADIIAQMSDRCYLEKCRDRLYPEFVAGGVARNPDPLPASRAGAGNPGHFPATPPSGWTCSSRARYDYAERHFGGQNLYLEEIHKNVRHARVVADAGRDELLRRRPPAAPLRRQSVARLLAEVLHAVDGPHRDLLHLHALQHAQRHLDAGLAARPDLAVELGERGRPPRRPRRSRCRRSSARRAPPGPRARRAPRTAARASPPRSARARAAAARRAGRARRGRRGSA